MNLSWHATTGPSTVAIVGSGGFARETLDVIDAHNSARPANHITVVGFVDRAPEAAARELLGVRGVRCLGSDEDWLASGDPTIPYVIAVGDPGVKRRLHERYTTAGRVAHRAIIHPDAGIGTYAVFGRGVIVCSGVQVSTNVRIGEHVHVNPNATIGHDAVLAQFVSVNPAAVISGHVHVAEGCLVGAGSVILERRRVGAWSTVGAAACVVHDVATRSTVKGVPAR